MNRNLLSLVFILGAFCTTNAQPPKVEMKTTLGSIVVELYADKAPITCKNFLKYIKNDKFGGLHFYRVVNMENQPNNDVKIEVIQGGLGFDESLFRYPAILHETTETTGVLHKNGVLSMARSEPETASSEFFICIGDQPSLDFGGKRNPDGQGFASFGKVIEGMEIVRKIQHLENDSQMLTKPVEITSIVLIDED